MDVEDVCAWCLIGMDDEGDEVRKCSAELFNDMKGNDDCIVTGSCFKDCKFYENRRKYMGAS